MLTPARHCHDGALHDEAAALAFVLIDRANVVPPPLMNVLLPIVR